MLVILEQDLKTKLYTRKYSLKYVTYLREVRKWRNIIVGFTFVSFRLILDIHIVYTMHSLKKYYTASTGCNVFL